MLYRVQIEGMVEACCIEHAFEAMVHECLAADGAVRISDRVRVGLEQVTRQAQSCIEAARCAVPARLDEDGRGAA